jgi:hypothetical protein
MSRLTFTDLETFKGTKFWERERSGDQKAVGAFGLKEARQDFTVYEVEEWELNSWLKGVVVKSNEKLFRYETPTSKIGGFKPVIKINLESGLVYFQESLDNEDMVFEKISAKPVWIDLNITVK